MLPEQLSILHSNQTELKESLIPTSQLLNLKEYQTAT